MAAATARGTSDACILAVPSPLAPADLESVQPAHDTALFNRTAGGATAPAGALHAWKRPRAAHRRLGANCRSAATDQATCALFGCSAGNRQTAQRFGSRH